MTDFSRKTYDYHDIPAVKARRVELGHRWLTRAFGHTLINDRIEYGIPLGASAIWSGGPGVGKTRVALSISAAITNAGGKVLFFQCESDLRQFRDRIDDFISCPRGHFLLSGFTDRDTMIAEIGNHQPTLVIIDSINMIDAFNDYNYCRKIMTSFGKAAQSFNCHVVFIGHLTKGGSTKGSADVEHLVDIVCDLERCKTPRPSKDMPNPPDLTGCFSFHVRKNRYGPAGVTSFFEHRERSIEEVFSTLPEFKVEQQQSMMGLPYNPLLGKQKKQKRSGFWSAIGLG